MDRSASSDSLFSLSNNVEWSTENLRTMWINQPDLLDLFRVLHEDIITNKISLVMPDEELNAATTKICDEFHGYPHFTAVKMLEMGNKLFDKTIYSEATVLFLVSARLYGRTQLGNWSSNGITECCKLISHSMMSMSEMYDFDESEEELITGKIQMIVDVLRGLIRDLDDISNVDRVYAEAKCLYWNALTLFELDKLDAFKDKLFEGFDLLDENLTHEQRKTDFYKDIEMWVKAYDGPQTTETVHESKSTYL